jgi:hypothetical protein
VDLEVKKLMKADDIGGPSNTMIATLRYAVTHKHPKVLHRSLILRGLCYIRTLPHFGRNPTRPPARACASQPAPHQPAAPSPSGEVVLPSGPSRYPSDPPTLNPPNPCISLSQVMLPLCLSTWRWRHGQQWCKSPYAAWCKHVCGDASWSLLLPVAFALTRIFCWT